MAMEILLIALAVVLFVGMLVGLSLSYREIEAGRTRAAVAARERRPARIDHWKARNAALAEQLVLRQIEHHLRQEAMHAEHFINNPSPETLRAGEQTRLGAC